MIPQKTIKKAKISHQKAKASTKIRFLAQKTAISTPYQQQGAKKSRKTDLPTQASNFLHNSVSIANESKSRFYPTKTVKKQLKSKKTRQKVHFELKYGNSMADKIKANCY